MGGIGKLGLLQCNTSICRTDRWFCRPASGLCAMAPLAKVAAGGFVADFRTRPGRRTARWSPTTSPPRTVAKPMGCGRAHSDAFAAITRRRFSGRSQGVSDDFAHTQRGAWRRPLCSGGGLLMIFDVSRVGQREAASSSLKVRLMPTVGGKRNADFFGGFGGGGLAGAVSRWCQSTIFTPAARQAAR